MLALTQPTRKEEAKEGIIEIITAILFFFSRGVRKKVSLFTLRTSSDVHDDNQWNIYTIMMRLESEIIWKHIHYQSVLFLELLNGFTC